MTAALAIGSLLAGTSPAHATAPRIPRNFLLTEPAAVKGPVVEDEEWWEMSDSLSRQLEFNPCRSKGKPHEGRVAMRTITYSTSAPSGTSEQLVLYRGRRLSQSDDLAVIGRRGAALFLYTANARGGGAKKEITGQARKMAKKVCGLPGVCG
ncbi:hypothetical protein [Nonomuraea bangladeshensis]|uniref:hypothetical protein n=1 Tax=Nonomuraea bangladeshensis TaxID=404385 RepID=UPI0031D670E1